MNRMDILTSPQLLKRFCRDYAVPVSTFQPPYFEKQLETLSLHDKSYSEHFEEFVMEVSQYDTAEDYFNYYNGVKEKIINYISSHPQFKSFSESTFRKSAFGKKEIYSELNSGKRFISIDLTKANFTIVDICCPETFGGRSWEKVVEAFGGTRYLQNSKYIRQVIFGACNPKKQIQAQTETMSDLADYLTNNGVSVYSVVTDELIVENDSYDHIYTLIHEYTTNNKLSFTQLKIEKFFLTKTESGYVKTIERSTKSSDIGKHKFKCVDGDVYCQFVKYFYGVPIEEHDLLFDYKGGLAKFLSPMGNPWSKIKLTEETIYQSAD